MGNSHRFSHPRLRGRLPRIAEGNLGDSVLAFSGASPPAHRAVGRVLVFSTASTALAGAVGAQDSGAEISASLDRGKVLIAPAGGVASIPIDPLTFDTPPNALTQRRKKEFPRFRESVPASHDLMGLTGYKGVR